MKKKDSDSQYVYWKIHESKPIKEILKGSPLSVVKLLPKWGDPMPLERLPDECIAKGEIPEKRSISKSSDKNSAYSQDWLLGKDMILEKWEDESFETFLKIPENAPPQEHLIKKEKETKTLLDIILEAPIGSLTYDFNGHEAAQINMDGLSRTSSRNKNDSIWLPLSRIMGSPQGEDKRRNQSWSAHDYLKTIKNMYSKKVPYTRQFYKFTHFHQTLEINKTTKSKESVFPNLDVPLNLNDPEIMRVLKEIEVEIGKDCGLIVVENTRDFTFPRAAKERDENGKLSPECFVFNGIVGGESIVDYYNSRYFHANADPVRKAVTKCLLGRSKYFIITSFNRFVFGKVYVQNEDDVKVKEGSYVVKVTKYFLVDNSFPQLAPYVQGWSLWEILTRFMLASLNTWLLPRFPNEMKKLFSTQRKGEEEEKIESNNSKRVKQEQFEIDKILTLAYSDLFDPLRFAYPPTHAMEVECSRYRLEKDAVFLGRGRTGSVFRKAFHDGKLNSIVKLCVFNIEPLNSDDPHPFRISMEMKNEWNIYCHLKNLQGKTIPKLYWYGTLIPNLMDALVTEDGGNILCDEDDDDAIAALPKELKLKAIQALDSLHDAGVLHRDVSLRNFVCKGEQVRIIDFGFSQFKTNFKNDQEISWEEQIKSEKKELRSLLQLVVEDKQTCISS